MSISNNSPKYLQEIEQFVNRKLKLLKDTPSELFEIRQSCSDQKLEIYREAFHRLIDKAVTYAKLLNDIKSSYEDALHVRNQRIRQFITHDKIFGISNKKQQSDTEINNVLLQNAQLKQQNEELTAEIIALKKDLGKVRDEKFSEYLSLMKERDARYSLYFENLALHKKVKELDGSSEPVFDAYGDPIVLRIALDRCREQLASTQAKLATMTDEYAETVPRRDYDILETKVFEINKSSVTLKAELDFTQGKLNRLQGKKKLIEDEFNEVKDRCSELERAGTPRPQWELCADFIVGGRDRWRQLASGLSSRDSLRVLLKELGPAAESDHLEHFDGLGLDPAIPPYLRYEGKVRNLRLSRREINVIINDIWLGKLENGHGMTLQEFVTKYFEDRYHQPSIRAEWAYNLCSGAEQMLDEPQVKLFWGVAHGHLSEDIYWGYRGQWQALKDSLFQICINKDDEKITMEEFEKIAKTTFPLKSDVDIKNLSEVVKKQLKIKINSNEVNLDKLFYENEEGFDKGELARELYRQRQIAQDKYIREVIAELGGKNAGNKMISVENLKRAFAIVDPAIDHIRMERNIKWAFSNTTIDATITLPLKVLAARLASGDIERIGPRYKGVKRRTHFK